VAAIDSWFAAGSTDDAQGGFSELLAARPATNCEAVRNGHCKYWRSLNRRPHTVCCLLCAGVVCRCTT